MCSGLVKGSKDWEAYRTVLVGSPVLIWSVSNCCLELVQLKWLMDDPGGDSRRIKMCNRLMKGFFNENIDDLLTWMLRYKGSHIPQSAF